MMDKIGPIIYAYLWVYIHHIVDKLAQPYINITGTYQSYGGPNGPNYTLIFMELYGSMDEQLGPCIYGAYNNSNCM